MEECSRKYPNDSVSAALQQAIRGKGAFRRFNDLIYEFSLQKKWDQFKQHAYEQMAIDWLEENGIRYTRGDKIEVDTEM